MKKIKVLLVDDSPICQYLLKKILNSSQQIEVVGSVSNGVQALKMIPLLEPDVVCTDFHMPEMNGLELTQRIMDEYPRPIIIFSSTLRDADKEKTFKMLQAGALELIGKPACITEAEFNANAAEIVKKISIIAGVKVFRKRRVQEKKQPSDILRPVLADQTVPEIVGIGASTGGPSVYQQIFQSLPAKFPVPIIAVQHIANGFTSSLVQWLDQSSNIRVKIAEDGEQPLPGMVYFAQEDMHLEAAQGAIRLNRRPEFDGHRPSVEVMFQSLACNYPGRSWGILLTGMGRDGAGGLKAMRDRGSVTIAQDEQTSVVFGMPGEAIKMGAVQHVFSPQEICSALLQLAKGK